MQKYQKKVLYADNYQLHLDTRCKFLENAGFKVIKARSLEEAKQVLENEYIHLAILDIRLVDDDDEGDFSGIELAKEEKYIRVPKIFVTGYPTVEAVEEALSAILGEKKSAYNLLSKKEGPEKLIAAINKVLEVETKINWELNIIWKDSEVPGFSYLAMLLDENLNPELLTRRGDELGDLFRKLFPTDEQISIVRMNWLRDGCACLTLFAINRGSSRQVIVIFGRNESVNDQRNKAEEYLAKESSLLPKPTFAESMRFAGLAYAIPGIEDYPLQIGSSFFHETGEKNVRIVLDNLYKQTLRNLHQYGTSEISNVNLASIYRDRLGIPNQFESLEDIRSKVRILADRIRSHSLMKEFSFEGKDILFVFTNGIVFRGPDPIAFLFDPHVFNKQSTAITSTFGGITSRSLLIDQECRVYPTDMSSITRSPILEDFISIECEFHFNIISTNNLLTLWDFEKQLGESKRLSDMLPGNVEPECRKAFAMILAVRKLAAEVAGGTLVPYLMGLFHHSIKMLCHYEQQIIPTKYQAAQLAHRLLAASLIITQIEKQMKDEDGPSMDSGEDDGLQINEASREVSVDGREVQLTQTEFKLLLYLYKNPNRLCAREEILSKVFEVKGNPTKSDKGLLNTHIDRLRKKIEINPAKHQYFVTIRGEGYRLNLKS